MAVAAPLALVALSGCARYHPQPLDGAGLAAVLEERRASADTRLSSVESISFRREALERVALLLNPGLHAARLDAGVAEASAAQAGRWADPVLGGDLARILNPDPGQDAELLGASLSFTIPLSGRLAVERARARAEARAALVGVWAMEQELLLDVRHACALLARESSALDAMRHAQEELRVIARLGAQLRDAGELSPAEAAAFQAAEVEGQIALRLQEAAAGAARLDVARLAGLPPGLALSLEGGADFEGADNSGSPSLAEVAARAPAALVAAAEHDVAEQRLRLAIRKQFPDLELGPLAGREDNQSQLGLGFSIPLPILDGNRREIAEAEAAREATRAKWELAVLAAESSLARLHVDLLAATERLELARESLLPLAHARMEQTRRVQEAGEANALLLLDALRAHLDARILVADAAQDVARARAEIAALLPAEPPMTTTPPEGRTP